MKGFSRLLLAGAAVALLAAGCADPNITNTSRSAIEQMLLSSVVERSIGSVNVEEFKGKKVWMDYANLATQVDKAYVQGFVELHFSQSGAIVLKDEKEAEVIVQVISGALATDSNKFMIGTPQLPIPLPKTDLSFAIPEIPLFKRIIRSGYGKFSLVMLEAKSRQPIRVVSDIIAKSEYVNWTILLLPFTSRDIDMAEATGFTDMSYDIFD